MCKIWNIFILHWNARFYKILKFLIILIFSFEVHTYGYVKVNAGAFSEQNIARLSMELELESIVSLRL